MANRDIYEENGRNYADKDPDNKWYYTMEITDELTLSNTTAETCIAITHLMTVIKQPQIQFDEESGRTFLVWMVSGPLPSETEDDEDAHVTLRVTCANEEQFDATLYYKAVQK